MILGNLNKLGEMKYLAPMLREMLIYLKKNDLTDAKPGKIELQGDKLFINVEENDMAPVSERRPEAHRKYLDIQLVLEGEEAIGVAVDSREGNITGVAEEYSEERDIIFYEGLKRENIVELYPGDFAVFFPEDIHRPRCMVKGTPGRSKKAVVKMKLEFLD